jgi:hypothetical protein
MAIDKTSRKETLTVSAGTNVVFTVPFEIEKTTDLVVYDSASWLAREGVDYTVTNYGLPGVTANAITVTWIGTTASGTYTFYRNFPMTQTVKLTEGVLNGAVENAFDRLTFATQNSTLITNNIISAAGNGITLMAEPTAASDAATVKYAQGAYSQGGYICPPVSGTDNNKALYAESTTSFIWKDPFDVPYPSAHLKILQVNGLGEPAWVDPVEYAPPYDTDKPKYLGVTLDLASTPEDSWVTVKQLPTLSKGVVGDTIVYQEGGYVAWQYVRWVPDVPSSLFTKKYLYNSTGTGVDGAVGSALTGTTAAAKATTIYENDTDKNAGGNSNLFLRSKTDQANVILLEFDVSSLSVDDYTDDSIVSCNLKLYIVGVSGSTNKTVHIRRLKNTFVEGTGSSSNRWNDDGATWEKPAAPGGTDADWNWGGAVGGGETNFDQDAELDYELPVSTFVMGSGAGTDTVGSEYTYVNVTPLFLDAIRNRSGILRLALYVPAAMNTSTSTLIRVSANEGGSTDVTLETTLAAARRAYWQKWGYTASAGITVVPDHEIEELWNGETYGVDWLYPHCKQSKSIHGVVPAHDNDSSTGRAFGCAYAIANEIYNTTEQGLHTAVSFDGRKHVCFIDRHLVGTAGFPVQADGSTLQVSQFWLENE